MRDGLRFIFMIFIILYFNCNVYCQDNFTRFVSGSASLQVDSILIIRDRGRTLDWSYANGLIAFSMLGYDEYYDIAIMKPDGSDVKCLTCNQADLPIKHISNPTWHPSGKYIVVQVEKEKHFGPSVFSTPGVGFNCDLWAITSDCKACYQLTNLPTKKKWRNRQPVTGVLHPHFSHDGTNKHQLTYFNTPGHPHYRMFNGSRVICADRVHGILMGTKLWQV